MWFSRSNLSPTNHTLKMTVDFIDKDAIFTLDYLIYTPSFATLAEQAGPDTSASPQPTSSSASPQASATPTRPPKAGLSRGALAVSPFPLPPLRTSGLTHLRAGVQHKSGTTMGWQSPAQESSSQQHLNIEIPDPNPLASGSSPGGMTYAPTPATQGRSHRWTHILRRTGTRPGNVEAFPLTPITGPTQQHLTLAIAVHKPNLHTSEALPANPITAPALAPPHHKPTLHAPPPTHNATTPARAHPSARRPRPHSRSSQDSANETIVADEDPQVQQLEELVFVLQQEIAETRERQDLAGFDHDASHGVHVDQARVGQDGGFMREMVGARRGSVAGMSSTMV
ncbi:hypothetical protein H0H87_010553 [Tephrocybe sp. NHM501043]|nr:hypothetical protein H0H87_010553 [Tephrocybe sp. NHM501043]